MLLLSCDHSGSSNCRITIHIIVFNRFSWSNYDLYKNFTSSLFLFACHHIETRWIKPTTIITRTPLHMTWRDENALTTHSGQFPRLCAWALGNGPGNNVHDFCLVTWRSSLHNINAPAGTITTRHIYLSIWTRRGRITPLKFLAIYTWWWW